MKIINKKRGELNCSSPLDMVASYPHRGGLRDGKLLCAHSFLCRRYPPIPRSRAHAYNLSRVGTYCDHRSNDKYIGIDFADSRDDRLALRGCDEPGSHQVLACGFFDSPGVKHQWASLFSGRNGCGDNHNLPIIFNANINIAAFF